MHIVSPIPLFFSTSLPYPRTCFDGITYTDLKRSRLLSVLVSLSELCRFSLNNFPPFSKHICPCQAFYISIRVMHRISLEHWLHCPFLLLCLPSSSSLPLSLPCCFFYLPTSCTFPSSTDSSEISVLKNSLPYYLLFFFSSYPPTYLPPVSSCPLIHTLISGHFLLLPFPPPLSLHRRQQMSWAGEGSFCSSILLDTRVCPAGHLVLT